MQNVPEFYDENLMQELGYTFTEERPEDSSIIEEAINNLPKTNAEIDEMEVQLNKLAADIEENLP